MASQLLSAAAVAELTSAYVFLRNLEHRLQYLDDQQTHTLPRAPEDRELIAASMGRARYEDLARDLEAHRAIESGATSGSTLLLP